MKFLSKLISFIVLLLIYICLPMLIVWIVNLHKLGQTNSMMLNYYMIGFVILSLVVMYSAYQAYHQQMNANSIFAEKTPFLNGKKIVISLVGLVALLSIESIFYEFYELFIGTSLPEMPDNQAIIVEWTRYLPMWLFIFDVAIVSPIIEELVMRGMAFNLFGKLHSRFTQCLALLFSSLLFGALHAIDVFLGLYALMGAVFCLVYLLTRDIRYPIVLHIINNSIGVATIYYDQFYAV